MSKEILFYKIRDVKDPQRGNDTDSGIDFFIPNSIAELKMFCKYTPTEVINTALMIKENITSKGICIPAKCGILIPSGIRLVLPKGEKWYTYDLVFENKSGVSTKYNLQIGAKVVDNGYRWEVHIHVINNSLFDVYLEPGQKIAQAILRKVELNGLKEIDSSEFEKHLNTERGEGWFGSTGTK